MIASAWAATTGAVARTTLSDWSDKNDDLGASVRFDTVSPFAVGAGIRHARSHVLISVMRLANGLIETLSIRCGSQTSVVSPKFLCGWRRSGACIARPTREGYRVVCRPRRTPRGACLGGANREET